MTHNPHLATLEQIAAHDPFEIIDTPWGRIEAWRASTMATGTMGALAQVHQIVRNDAAELQEKLVELDAKKHAVLSTINRLVKFMSRVDSLAARIDALEAKRRADEAERERLEEEPLTLPPDLAAYQSSAPPKEIGDETHQPGGELHSVAAKSEQEEEPEPASDLPEPPLEVEDNDMGGVPLSYKSVPTSYVRGGPKDNVGDLPEELELAEPPDLSSEPKGSVLPQPTALFGN